MTRVFLLFLAVVSVAYAEFKCPDKQYKQHADPEQCDKFYQCEDGVATEKLCPDGLVFDPNNRFVNKCDQPFNVECGDRDLLQEPKGTGPCPRRNGFFSHPDPTICDVWYNCIENESVKITCSAGLHFDELSGTCVWPETAKRENCGAVGKTLKDGFECPKDRQVDTRGQLVDHPRYAHPEDCQKFYICLSGVTPREQGCSDGTVYNDATQMCDAPENVPGCENWYKDDEQKP